MQYEALEHAVDLPRAGVYARHLARFEREFAHWMASDDGRHAAWRARRTLARDGVSRDDAAARRRQAS
jgi:hypothetical protein